MVRLLLGIYIKTSQSLTQLCIWLFTCLWFVITSLMSLVRICYVLHENNIFCVSKLWEIVKDREAWWAAVHGISKPLLSDWTTTCKFLGFPGCTNFKELACQCRRCRDVGRSPGREDSQEEDMANHSSILPGESPWTEEAGGLLSIGLQRIRHDLWTKQQCMSVSVFNKRLQEPLGKGHVSFCFLYVKFSIVPGS